MDRLLSPYHRERSEQSPITYDPDNAALPEQGRHLHADAGVDLRRDPDVGYRELADDRSCGGSEEPGLGQSEREGRSGSDAGIVGVPRPGVQT